MSQKKEDQLHPGQSAPAFKAQDVYGKEHVLEQFRGKKVMVSFYRYVECIYCNLRIHEVMNKHETYKKNGLEIISFFQSPGNDILKNNKDSVFPFPVIGDPERKIYKLYKVEEHSLLGFIVGSLRLLRLYEAMNQGKKIKAGYGSRTLIPADFLIDENGIIVKAYYGNDISDHIPFPEIERFLNIK